MSGQPRSRLRVTAEEGPLEEMIQRVGLSGAYSDLTVECSERSWPVHKLILAPRSEHFKILFDGEYKDKDTLELVGVAPDTVDRMIKFVYSSDYDDEPQTDAEKALSAGANVLINARVYVLAENHQIPALKTLACEKMNVALLTAWNTINFFKAVALIWYSTVRSSAMRQQLVACMAQHRLPLFKRPDFHALLRNDGNLAVDFMIAVHNSPNTANNITMLWCATPGCQKEQHIRCAVCNKASNLSFISQDDVP